jgi:hypothetical protein
MGMHRCRRDLADAETWYKNGGQFGTSKYQIGPGMVEMYQSPGMWNNRQFPRVHQAFAEIHGTPKLTVSMDRVNVKPPMLDGSELPWGEGLGLHWDGPRPRMFANAAEGGASEGQSDLTKSLGQGPGALRTQGALQLSDSPENGGGFICVPGFHNEFEAWAQTLPEEQLDKGFGDQGSLAHLKPINVATKKGDLLIWNRLLPHGNGVNTSDKPRIAQFIAMNPAPEGGMPEDVVAGRVAEWQKAVNNNRTNEKLDLGAFGVEEREMPVAELSELGQRLLGVVPWD